MSYNVATDYNPSRKYFISLVYKLQKITSVTRTPCFSGKSKIELFMLKFMSHLCTKMQNKTISEVKVTVKFYNL